MVDGSSVVFGLEHGAAVLDVLRYLRTLTAKSDGRGQAYWVAAAAKELGEAAGGFLLQDKKPRDSAVVFRFRMVRLAALAIAAVENEDAKDRVSPRVKTKTKDEPGKAERKPGLTRLQRLMLKHAVLGGGGFILRAGDSLWYSDGVNHTAIQQGLAAFAGLVKSGKLVWGRDVAPHGELYVAAS